MDLQRWEAVSEEEIDQLPAGSTVLLRPTYRCLFLYILWKENSNNAVGHCYDAMSGQSGIEGRRILSKVSSHIHNRAVS